MNGAFFDRRIEMRPVPRDYANFMINNQCSEEGHIAPITRTGMHYHNLKRWLSITPLIANNRVNCCLSSLSLSLSLAHTPHRSSLFRRVLSLTLPFAIYISVPLPRYRSRLPPKRICSCKRSRKIVENRRLRLSTLYLLRAFSRSTAISPSFPNTVFFSSSADYKIMEKTGGGEKRKRKRAITIVTRPIVP